MRIAGTRVEAVTFDDGAPFHPPTDDVAVGLRLGGPLPPDPGEHDSYDLGPVPLVVRPLRLRAVARWLPLAARLPGVPLVAPQRPSGTGVREIFVREPRMTRLWERFSVDVGAAIERDAAFFAERVFDRMSTEGYRVMIVEDGDRYAVRAACVFVARAGEGRILELLHDRTLFGMRGASRLLGIALRELVAVGVDHASAWSLPQSGSFPMFARHGFLPVPARLHTAPQSLSVVAYASELEHVVSNRDRWYVSRLDDDRA